jgi:hypothetical protein
MHLCMQEDQISPNIVVLPPADMARLSSSIISKMFLAVNNLVCQLGRHLLWTFHALQGKSSMFDKAVSF